MRWDAVGQVHWYSILCLTAQEVLLFSIRSMSGCQDKHVTDWQPSTSVSTETGNPATCVHILFPHQGWAVFLFFFHASFPAGIWLLSGNSPDCLPVVVGNGWQWFGLKCYQMRCGGVNPDIFPLLYSLLPLLVSVHLRRSEAKWTEVHYLHSR